MRPVEILPFLALCRRGRPMKIAQPPAGMAQREFEQQHQRAELERSIAALRRHGSGGRDES